MQICFVGNENTGYFAGEVAQELGGSCRYVKEALKVNEQTNQILASRADFVIYDVEQYTDPVHVMIVDIQKIQKANNADVIIYAPGYLIESEMIQECLKAGFDLYILSNIPSVKKDQLNKCMNGYYRANPIPGLKVIEDDEIAAAEEKGKSQKTVAITGTMGRIGTTTQAIQIIKYLMLKGWKACYIEMNEKHFVEDILSYDSDVVFDEDLQMARLNNIDMFYNTDRLSEYLKLDYDYYIYDYGVYNSRNFNKVSFLEKQTKIAVCGFKHSEIKYTMDFLRNPFYQDCSYIFSFVLSNGQGTVKELMEDRADKTYFAGYSPEMFFYDGKEDKLYESILNCGENVESAKKKKFSLFGRGKR